MSYPDKELMEESLAKFDVQARSKFLAGIREHNPDGEKGLSRMSNDQIIAACREEIIDLWFYLSALEKNENNTGN